MNQTVCSQKKWSVKEEVSLCQQSAREATYLGKENGSIVFSPVTYKVGTSLVALK